MLKKSIATLLTLMTAFSLCACGSNTTTTENTATPAITAAADETSSYGLKYLSESQVYPEITVKIGVPQYDETDSSAIAMRAYFDYLSSYLNIEFVYSEALASAEDELAFIENCSVSGCQAIMGSYDVIGHTVIDTCAEYGMYYLLGPSDMSVMSGDLYEQYKDNPYWIGGITLGNVNYLAGQSVANYLIKNNVKKVCYASGGASFGVEMFVKGQQGFNDALSAAGSDMEVIDLPGFPNDDWFATQASILADPDLEAVAGLATPNFWAQPMITASRQDILLVSASGALDGTNKAALEDGSLDFICFNNVEEHALNIIILINALNGDLDMVKPDGSTVLVDANCWEASDSAFFDTVYDMANSDEHIIDINDFCSLIKGLNPDVTFDDVYTIIGETDLDAIKARHAENKK